jgi:2-methylcitrate dehydratase
MTKNIAEYLADYATSIKYEDFTPEAIHKVKSLLIDTLGCALGAYNSLPVRIARKLAESIYQCNLPANILGSGRQSSPELATFANGVMIRYLDFNDGFASKGVGHPSDHFAPILTCADAIHAGGKEVIVASILAYEIFCRLADKIDIRNKGFDHTVLCSTSCVLGTAKLLGLSQEQMVQAINLAVTSNITLGQARVSDLSMWKGCATANTARNAVFATLMAKEGMTGPSPVFEGRYGLQMAITGSFQLDEFGGNGRSFRIMDVMIKQYPCGQVAQTAIDAAIKLRSKISSIKEISEVNISTFASGKNIMAGDPEKWQPRTRESADHSLPYVVAIALMYGSVQLLHFDDKYLSNIDLFELIQKIKVEETQECNILYPDAMANRLELVTSSGRRFSELVQYHKGHPKNPLCDEEIEQKFISLTGDLLTQNQKKQMISLVWNLEEVHDISELMMSVKV